MKQIFFCGLKMNLLILLQEFALADGFQAASTNSLKYLTKS